MGSRWCRERHAFQGRLRPIIHQTDNYWWRDVDLRVWHALQTSSEWMAFTQWAATEKTTSFSVEKGGNAYGFHELQRCCASWIPSRRPDRQQGVLFWRYKTFAWSNSPKKDRICGQTTRGFCTTITHRRTMPSLSVSIWLKTKRIPSNNHRIHLIWLPATFSYSVDSRNRSAERVATAPEMRSWKNRRWLWWLYRKPIIKNVSRIGSSAGISALQSMGSTLKGTMSIMMNKLIFLI